MTYTYNPTAAPTNSPTIENDFRYDTSTGKAFAVCGFVFHLLLGAVVICEMKRAKKTIKVANRSSINTRAGLHIQGEQMRHSDVTNLPTLDDPELWAVKPSDLIFGSYFIMVCIMLVRVFESALVFFEYPPRYWGVETSTLAMIPFAFLYCLFWMGLLVFRLSDLPVQGSRRQSEAEGNCSDFSKCFKASKTRTYVIVNVAIFLLAGSLYMVLTMLQRIPMTKPIVAIVVPWVLVVVMTLLYISFGLNVYKRRSDSEAATKCLYFLYCGDRSTSSRHNNIRRTQVSSGTNNSRAFTSFLVVLICATARCIWSTVNTAVFFADGRYDVTISLPEGCFIVVSDVVVVILLLWLFRDAKLVTAYVLEHRMINMRSMRSSGSSRDSSLTRKKTSANKHTLRVPLNPLGVLDEGRESVSFGEDKRTEATTALQPNTP